MLVLIPWKPVVVAWCLLAAMLCRAWKRYLEEYGMPPDGSFEQLQELVHLVPEVRRILKKD